MRPKQSFSTMKEGIVGITHTPVDPTASGGFVVGKPLSPLDYPIHFYLFFCIGQLFTFINIGMNKTKGTHTFAIYNR